MGTIKLTPGEFRQQLARYTLFRLEYAAPLSPLTIDALFERANVCFGVGAYLSLRNSDLSITVSHIQKIRKWGAKYFLQCLDYSGEKPIEVTYRLECI